MHGMFVYILDHRFQKNNTVYGIWEKLSSDAQLNQASSYLSE